jgi:hypothetical protein
MSFPNGYGALTELAATAALNAILTDNSQVTFYKQIYQRHIRRYSPTSLLSICLRKVNLLCHGTPSPRSKLRTKIAEMERLRRPRRFRKHTWHKYALTGKMVDVVITPAVLALGKVALTTYGTIGIVHVLLERLNLTHLALILEVLFPQIMW